MPCPMNRQKKIFRVSHQTPGDFRLDYILLPFGYSYNADIAKAKQGDTVRFVDGKDVKIVAVRKVRINTIGADILCRMRYDISIKGALMRWQSNAKIEGHGAKAVSTEECLWVIYEKDEKEN